MISYQYLFILKVSFMRHYDNMPLFIIFYYLYLHISYLLASICCYQISDFTIRAPLTARINFGANYRVDPLPTICQII